MNLKVNESKLSIHSLKNWTHAAWVPTTTGHLSFSNIGLDRNTFFHGTSGFNTLEHDSGNSIGSDTAVCLLQHRPNNDSRLPLRFLGWIWRTFGIAVSDWSRQWAPEYDGVPYFLVGRAITADTPYISRAFDPSEAGHEIPKREDRRGAIVGSVHAFQARRGLYGSVGDVFRLRKMSSWIADAAEGSQKRQLKVAKVTDYILSRSSQVETVDFILYRTGELRLSTRRTKTNLSSIRQAYYFVRDCAHNHHHHAKHEDQHLPVVDAGEWDDMTWRKRTLWSLARSAGQNRRNRSAQLTRRRQGLGILAYADAFQGLLAQVKRCPSGHSFSSYPDFATYNFSHQRASIAAANDEATWKQQGRSATIIAVVATLFSTSLLYNSSISTLVASGHCGVRFSADDCAFFSLNPVLIPYLCAIVVSALFASYFVNFYPSSSIVQTPRKLSLALISSIGRIVNLEFLGLILGAVSLALFLH